MRSKKVFVVTVVCFLFFIPRMGLSQTDFKKPKVILKMASNAPEGMELTNYIKNEITIGGIERVTDGEVTFSWYHGGVMGDDEDWIVKMDIDQLQGAGLDASGVDIAVPELGVMQLPFIFNDVDEIAYLRKTLRQRITTLFEDKGYKPLILGEQPFDDIYSIKREIRTPGDFTKAKFAAYYSVVAKEALKALGAGQIPISVPEIVSSMRAGICDSLICPALWYVGSQLYTITYCVIPSNIRCTMGGIVITMKAWERIPEKHHESILEVMRELEPGFTGPSSILSNNNERCYKAMIKYGIKELKLTPDELEVLKNKTRPVWDKLAGNVYPRELLDTILGHLEEYRSDYPGM
ncbi:MAG: TRAP transporter substrate-binding protein DctP [Thermodesulfobacteriota bacterium]|nr:TRAP transporter substrate-binding protein DctP [Thermodesulfobacteriota bacterium]